MGNKEKDLSEYIDQLNAEKRPTAHDREVDSAELDELMETVRLVKGLKEPVMPEKNYDRKVSKVMSGQKPKRTWYMGAASVAAVFLLVVLLNFTGTFGRNNIVYAMEQAYKEVKAYHGVLVITQVNEKGEETSQAERVVWATKTGQYYIQETVGTQKDMITVNNGEKKWQIHPDSKQAYVFAAFPDPYQFTFELGKEIENAKNAIEVRAIGEEQVSAREAVILEIIPKGGAAYKLWVDKETNLPLKKQSAMQNALQYTITYAEIEFLDALPTDLMTYKLPEGFAEISTSNEQFVGTIEEAEELTGFGTQAAQHMPEGYVIDGISVELDDKLLKVYYTNADKQKTVVMLQRKAVSDFKPASSAILGSINEKVAEIQSPIEGGSGILAGGGLYAGITDITSIRWQQNGFEYAILGDASFEDLALFVKQVAKGALETPEINAPLQNKPEIDAPVDLEIEQNEQRNVDAGHMPWKLDPVFVAHVFVSLQMSPEGIQGEYPVKYEDFKVVQNNGEEALVEVGGKETTISKVYLKRLIRQDNTGIWTVVGYDLVENE